MSTYNKTINAYQATYELLVAMSKAIISFAREYKYTFWERIINYTLDATAEVYLAKDAYWSKEKIEHIDKALKSIALLWVLWKACWEIPNLSINVYVEQMENITNISKQLRSWHEYCEKNADKDKK